MVGDREVDERVAALVAAAREALVNAARHAKVQTVSLYAEVEPDQVSVFVRDRGAGFDPDRGRGRTGTAYAARSSAGCSGTAARRRSAAPPGDGTEVRLILPIPGTRSPERSTMHD